MSNEECELCNKKANYQIESVNVDRDDEDLTLICESCLFKDARDEAIQEGAKQERERILKLINDIVIFPMEQNTKIIINIFKQELKSQIGVSP